MYLSFDLLANAIVAGILLGGFYAAVALGVTVAFGMLDIVNIAHPAVMMIGAFMAYLGLSTFGLSPFLTMALLAVAGLLAGPWLYRAYYALFEKRGDESLQGLAFFFGILFIVEISLVMTFGVDYRGLELPYLSKTYDIGFVSLPMRMLIPFGVSMLMCGACYAYLFHTFTGRTILAVAQDVEAVRLIGADPLRSKGVAFGIAMATGLVAGVLLIVIQPVEPSIGREFIGRSFAVCVLGGITSITGTVTAAMILGVAETLTSTLIGPSWSPAISFGLLLLTLAFRPAGIFGR